VGKLVRGKKPSIIIGFLGLTISIVLFFIFLFSVKANTTTLCSYQGPDLSKDLIRLTDFSVTGPTFPKEGDKIVVKFTLENFGQSDLNLGKKGVFSAARDPDNLDASFGFSYQNSLFKLGSKKTITVEKVLNKSGTWKIWPSYHLSLATGEKYGPDEWHTCILNVSQKIQDSDKDGVADDKDNCPNIPNPDQSDIDKDNIGDVCDSCDDRDFDKDGIRNCQDKCPEKPETFNNYQDDDGCPDEVPKKVVEDTTPPEVDITISPESPKTTDKIIFHAKAEDSSGIKEIRIFINNQKTFTCKAKCSFEEKLAQKCSDFTKIGKNEAICDFKGGPYSVGTLTYKAEAFDNSGNKSQSDQKEVSITREIEISTPGVGACLRFISGKVFDFPYNLDTLKIKLYEVKAYWELIESLEVSSEDYTFQTTVPCEEKYYVLQPEQEEVEGECSWQGNWEPERYIFIGGIRNISNKDFTFHPVETEKPHIDIWPGETENVSDNEIISFPIRVTDNEGVVKIWITQSIDGGPEQEVKVCESRIPSGYKEYNYCDFRGGPFPGSREVRVTVYACDRNGNQADPSTVVFHLINAHCLNHRKDADEEDIDCGGEDCLPCRETCDDGIQNRDEQGIDCGGSYCPPCSQCETSAKWAPRDTPCRHHWPTDEGPKIGMNTEDNSCAIIEVCHPELDYIVQDALTCCEHPDFNLRFSGHRESGKEAACRYARRTSGIDTDYNPVTFKKCLGLYGISSLGAAAVYMQNYFWGEICCSGDDYCTEHTDCSKWGVNPPAWKLGKIDSCAGPHGATPDFQMGGHRCVYNQFGWCAIRCWKWKEPGYWHSDTDFTKNNDSMADVPVHASINKLSTGTCVDYSFALTTILRKLGYSKDDILSVNGKGHGYNLVRFPGDTKWHYVDTVGNAGGEVNEDPNRHCCKGTPQYIPEDPVSDACLDIHDQSLCENLGCAWHPALAGPECFGPADRGSCNRISDQGTCENLTGCSWEVCGYDYCRNMDAGCSNDYYSQSKAHCPPNDEIKGCEGIPR